MLGNSSQAILADLILKCIQGENKAEIARISLSEKYDFSPLVFFKLVTQSIGISSRDLKKYLNFNEVTVDESLVFMLIKQYSCLQDGRVSIEDFYQLVLPSTNPALRERAISRPLISTYADSTLALFKRLIEEELKFQGELEKLKENLYIQKDFTVYAGFESLAKGKQVVNPQDLVEFMKKNQNTIGEKDLDAILRRIDVEADGVISYNEFLEFIIPFNVPDKETTLELTLEKSGAETENLLGNINRSEVDESKKKVDFSELLIELLLSVRSEESRKQELAMISDFSIESTFQFLDISRKGHILATDLSDFLSLQPSEIVLLLENASVLSQDSLQSLLSPFAISYKALSPDPPYSPLTPISQKFLKAALLSILSTKKIISAWSFYKSSSLAATRGHNESPSTDFTNSLYKSIGVTLSPNDLSLLISRLE